MISNWKMSGSVEATMAGDFALASISGDERGSEGGG